MYFSLFLEKIEGTEHEARFWEAMAFIEDEEIKVAFEKAQKMPVVGKTIAALHALYEMKDIEAFRDSEHFKYIKDWNVKDGFLEGGGLSLTPSDIHGKKIAGVLKYVGIGVSTLLVLRKIRKFKNRKASA